MRTSIAVLIALAGLGANTHAEIQPVTGDQAFISVRDAYLAKFEPVLLESNHAWWEANTTGTDKAFARKKAADQVLVELHSQRDVFAQLKALRANGSVTDTALKRQLEVMFNTFLPAQADTDLQKRIIEIENNVEQSFNTHRSEVGGRRLTENEVREILLGTTESDAAEEAWKAYMRVGAKAKDQLRELVKLRNQLARELEFDNYYVLRLQSQEIDEREFFELFDELDRLTREPFRAIKTDIDNTMAKRFNISSADLRPWHFGDLFFQEAPSDEEVNLDEIYERSNLIEFVERYYASIGLP